MRRRFLNKINKSVSSSNGEYFTIEALEDDLTAQLSVNACEYRIDNGSWNNLSASSNTPSINKGQTLSFRGNLTPNSSIGIGTFTVSKKCNLKGNIMSLLYGDDFKGQTHLIGKNYAFNILFYNCKTIVDVSELILPSTILAYACYSNMFNGCTSLTEAPELPATTLANNCYEGMFKGCTSLIEAPELLATELAYACYSNMFNGTNVLPDCSNIDFTSESVVASGGLQGLFAGTKVTDDDLERILPKNNEGKYCLPATTLANSCYSGMFNGCISLTKAPQLPATTITKYCYERMFYGCTSLTEAPQILATTLANNCYYYMFNGCSKLNKITMLATDISASYCLYNWVNGVSPNGTFVKNANMDSLPSGTSGIPNGWTVINDGEESGGSNN